MFLILRINKHISIFLIVILTGIAITSCADPLDERSEVQATNDILMVIRISQLSGLIEEADYVTRDSLILWGYSVEMVEQRELETVDITNYRVIYFSESMNSEFVEYYRSLGYPVPAFSHEPYILDRLGLGRVNQEARDQQAVIEEMKIIASNHIITDGIWESGELVKVTENSQAGTHDVFQFEFDLDDPEFNSRVHYNALGKTNLDNEPWKGFPTWAVIYGGYGPLPDGIDIVIHAFHLGASLKGTPVYWMQVRRSIQYLLDEL